MTVEEFLMAQAEKQRQLSEDIRADASAQTQPAYQAAFKEILSLVWPAVRKRQLPEVMVRPLERCLLDLLEEALPSRMRIPGGPRLAVRASTILAIAAYLNTFSLE
jgi:hypothetical protein